MALENIFKGDAVMLEDAHTRDKLTEVKPVFPR